MADNTRMKEMAAKIDTLFALLDQREEKMIAALDQRDEKFKLLEQSLLQMTKCMEALQVAISTSAPTPSQPLPLDQADDSSDKQLVPFYPRSVRMEFPHFQGGDDVLNWIFKAEQFFSYYGVSDKYRLEIASIHFDGPVVPWFQMLVKTKTLTSWAALVENLQEDYGPSALESPEYSLFKLTQEDSVNNYYSNFINLANRVEGVAPKALLACFISGLKKELQRDIIPWKPDTIPKAAALARLFEDRYPSVPFKHTRKPQFSPDIHSPFSSGRIGFQHPKNYIAKTSTSNDSGASTSGNISSPYKRITFNEMQVRKAKGLCFNYEEKYSPSHKCANKQLLLLQ